jgi:ATP-binding cassette subfamily B protein/ATP-binding cassette subfamily B multidrug efflux pump
MFRGILITLVLCTMAVEVMSLAMVWGLSVIVDGVTQQGAAAFLHNDRMLLIFLGLMLSPCIPIGSFLANTLTSHTLGIGMPAAIQWQGHRAVEH